MAEVKKVQNAQISPVQRAQLFAQSTRQKWQMLPAISGTPGNVVSFSLPKVGLLSKIRLLMEGTVNAVHASSETFDAAPFAPFSLIKNIRIESNLGYTFFNLSGRDLYFYNLLREQAESVTPVTANAATSRAKNVLGLVADAAADGGADNVCRISAELPITLNERDPIGIILLANEETVITVTIEFNELSSLAADATGFTFTTTGISISPMVETFSIPAIAQAFPDISILKQVQSKRKNVPGAGPFTMELPTGLIYRKLLLYVEDSSGGVADGGITGDLELILNQADIPYRVKPRVLSAINSDQYGLTLPDGLFVFDFSYQGLSNYGGARDYIDTERLTEFWFRFQAAGAGEVTAIYELLSRLRG